MEQTCKKYKPLPVGTPLKGGDKKCGTCETEYNRAELRLTAVFRYGAYWINCANCHSTLFIKGENK